MTEQLETRLRYRLRALALPPAPDALHDVVDGLPVSDERRRSTAPFRALAIAAVLVVGGAVAVIVGGPEPRLPAPSMPPPGPTATDGAAVATAPTSSSPSPSGERIYTVSEFLEARDAGELAGRSVTVAGYWSEGVPHSCPFPAGNPGALELYCRDGDFGITEREEPIWERRADGLVRTVSGPLVTPYVEVLASRYMVTPPIDGGLFPPVPTVVRGHINDARATDCRPRAQQLCRERFVIEEVLSFQPRLLPQPEAVPNPTAFPSPDPSAPFVIEDCYGQPDEVVSEGWIAADEIDIGLDYDGRIYAIVTEHLDLTDWLTDPSSGEKYRVWSQWVCYREDFYLGTDLTPVFGKPIGATMYWEYEDGRRVAKPGP
jgi:hypothetical protein